MQLDLFSPLALAPTPSRHRALTEWCDVFIYPSRNFKYYRLAWGVGDRILGQIHIPGGSVGKSVPDSRADQVREAIQAGSTLVELSRLIRGFSKKRPGRAYD